MIIQGCKRWLS